jgi:gas vesicle protein
VERKKAIKGGTVMSNEKINSKDFLIGTLVGGIVGATSALLFAPKSGRDLRDNIQLQASQVLEKTNNLSHVAKEKSNEFAEYAKNKKIDLSEQSASVMEKVKEWKDTAEELKRDIEEVKREVSIQSSDESK